METSKRQNVETSQRGFRLCPILFSGEMVRAILSGRKTQTRRVLLPKHCLPGARTLKWENQNARELLHSFRPPHGKAGDIQWVRETFFRGHEWNDDGTPGPDRYFYKADRDAPDCPATHCFAAKR